MKMITDLFRSPLDSAIASERRDAEAAAKKAADALVADAEKRAHELVTATKATAKTDVEAARVRAEKARDLAASSIAEDFLEAMRPLLAEWVNADRPARIAEAIGSAWSSFSARCREQLGAELRIGILADAIVANMHPGRIVAYANWTAANYPGEVDPVKGGLRAWERASGPLQRADALREIERAIEGIGLEWGDHGSVRTTEQTSARFLLTSRCVTEHDERQVVRAFDDTIEAGRQREAAVASKKNLEKYAANRKPTDAPDVLRRDDGSLLRRITVGGR